MSYLVLKCGSAARGDANACSDVDYVCLHHDADNTFRRLKEEYPQISFYSAETIRRMKQKGSLFLTHLDVDGVIIEGDENLLNEISGYRPAHNQLSETVKESINFIEGIGWFPDSKNGFLWLNDVLFVSLRNILYCVNAMHSVFAFAFEDAMKAYGLNSADSETLQVIRQWKYSFRSGTIPPDPPPNYSSQIASVATVVTQKRVNFTPGGLTQWRRNWIYDYWDERFIERAIINGEISDNGFLELLKDHNYRRHNLSKEMKTVVKKAQQCDPGS